MSNKEKRAKILELMNAFGDAKATRNDYLVKATIPVILAELKVILPDDTDSNETPEQEESISRG